MSKRIVIVAMAALALVAAALPFFGLKAGAAEQAWDLLGKKQTKGRLPVAAPQPEPAQDGSIIELKNGQKLFLPQQADPVAYDQRPIDPELVKSLGIVRPEGLSSKDAGELMMRALTARSRLRRDDGEISPQQGAGLPDIINRGAAFSAAVITTIGGRDTQFDSVHLLADWDGREDLTADHAAEVDDFSTSPFDIDFHLTRAAISEHTVANGFNENIYYYGDSVGNVYVGADTAGTPGVDPGFRFTINLPTVLNAFGSLNSDDQVVITGLAVSPVADLTSFFNVNSTYTAFNGVTGEILYVAFWDTGSGLRLAPGNVVVRSGILAFPISDATSPAPSAPGVISPAGFPVTVGGAFGVAFSVFSNLAGCAVDDDGNLYFQQVDLIQFTGGNIVKVTDTGSNQDRSLAVTGIVTLLTLNPTGGVYGTTSGPASQVNRFTNYSGTTAVFGNIVALAAGQNNRLYAAVARSAGSGDDITSGRFSTTSSVFPAGTPSMIITFADCSGAFDSCTAAVPGTSGILPIADGFADPAAPGDPIRWRAFVLGNGPDIRTGTTASSAVTGTPANTLKVDMQIDYTVFSGLAVDEAGSVYVVSGGTPAGIGTNPSPLLGEILLFPDSCPADQRGDFIDLRGNQVPNPPASGGNIGDGDSDRFDHIFWQAPIDQSTVTPTGIAGLATGFLRYTNRLAPNPISTGITLGQTGGQTVLGDNTFAGPINFNDLDRSPTGQVAGGDDAQPPSTGDDAAGGFEFLFGGSAGPPPVCNPLTSFFWNSNGNITFGSGDVDNTPTIAELRGGPARLAPAWADLNPSSRVGGLLNTFPVMALGFAGVNEFAIRWINVPEFGFEACGSRNTFAIHLFDDGTGVDENAPGNPQEGPTDLRFTAAVGNVVVGCPPRLNGTGYFYFTYGRMDLLGTAGRPVIVGYSIGGLSPLNPPGLCEINLSTAAAAADTAPFGVIQGTTASVERCLIGEVTESHLFELFNSGRDPSIGSGGEVTLAVADFDLRTEGNDARLCTPVRQTDPNRERVGFFGTTCGIPDPSCAAVVAAPFAVAPNQSAALINAVCGVQLTMVGCGFYPNETTIVCQGFADETGLPLQRPGKTVTNTMTLGCDTDGNGSIDITIPLVNVTPLNRNAVRGDLRPAPPTTPIGTAFPLTCCGGVGNLAQTFTFSTGDNNRFGTISRTATCALDLGVRAPVVISATPAGPFDCTINQNILISGACFLGTVTRPGAPNVTLTVTSVFAVERGNPANVVPARTFTILSSNLIDADFLFGSANAGKTFLIFATGPGGQSRNLLSLPTGAQFCPAGYTSGNENGIQVTITCQAPPAPRDVPTLTSCALERTDAGGFVLVVTGSNIKSGATVTVSGQTPNKVKFRGETSPGSGVFTRLVLKGGVCRLIPGPIVVTNPGATGGASQPLQCNARCPSS